MQVQLVHIKVCMHIRKTENITSI